MNNQSKDNRKSTDVAFAAGQYRQEKEYWLNKLAGEPVKSTFPCDNTPPITDERTMAEINTRYTGDLFEKLTKVSTGKDHRLHMVLVTALMLLLERYTATGDILIGTTIYRQETEGEYLNTLLPLRNTITEEITFKKMLMQVKQTVVEAVKNQNYPVETLQQQLQLPQTGDEYPLFDTVLLLENIQDKKYMQQIKYNMMFSFLKTAEAIETTLEYNTLRYEKETVERIAGQFTHLLTAAVSAVETPVAQLELMTLDEKKHLLLDFNETTTEYPANETIHAIFEKQAVETPGNTAVNLVGTGIRPDADITYIQLNEKSAKLAAKLRTKGVREESIVAIMAENSLEMITAVLAILKAGAAYLPLNKDYPEERKKYMITDSSVKILLTNIRGVDGYGSEIIDLEEPQDKTAPINDTNREQSATTENPAAASRLAYVIYTSGSTGKPKGVLVEHRNVVRLVKNTNFIKFSSRDRILQTGALEFDASTFEIWGALLNGLRLYLADDMKKIVAPDTFRTVIKKHKITILWLTSPLFNLISQTPAGLEAFGTLKTLLVGGDVLSPQNIGNVMQKHPNLTVINGYGPTENTTFSTTFNIDKPYTKSIPIGSPIANSTAYIVDKSLNPVPLGVPGELLVGGDGVARGYLNNPELTAQRFTKIAHEPEKGHQTEQEVKSPTNKSFCGVNHTGLGPAFFKKRPPGGPPEASLYHTGDLCYWQPDGNIQFIGRVDHQVKIRGFRIELGEIERQILKHETVKEAIVVARQYENDEKLLCAYITPAATETGQAAQFSVNTMKEHLHRELPPYMIPTHIVELEKLPKTTGGKIDRKALPDPKTMMGRGENYVAPETEIEKLLASIWAEVLGLKETEIGVHDDFYELGGNSINILKVQSRVMESLDRDLSMSSMFLYPTISELAANIEKDSLLHKLECIVRLNKGETGKNLFILHPMNGMIYQYKEMAGALEGKFDVYGVMSRGLMKKSRVPETMELMVADYVHQIRQVQEEGPYIIVGFCVGNLVAYNIVKLLEDLGSKVQLLILFDQPEFLSPMLLRHYRPIAVGQRLASPMKKIAGSVAGKKYASPGKARYEELLIEIKRRNEQNAKLPRVPIDSEEADTMKARVKFKITKLDRSFFDGTRRTSRISGIINAPVLVFDAKDSNFVVDPTHMKKMTFGKFRIEKVPGGHESVFQKPDLDNVVKILKELDL
ncbi:MAG: amino acid adenylation domain-containing protein [bacterium]|nr:amino acid adenylation domain-containing protein [bacterium]